MFMDYDFSLSASEIVRSRECLLIMSQSSEYLKCIARAVGSCIARDVYTAKGVAAVDAGCCASQNFGMCLNELGIVLCPPQVKENILATVNELIASADSLSDALKEMVASTGSSVQSIETESVKGSDDASLLASVSNGLSQLKETAADVMQLQ